MYMKHFLLFLLVTVALLLGGRTSKAQLAAPTNVTATPSAINAGYSSILNATSVGNQIRWYNVSSGGSPLITVNSGANYSVYPNVTTTYYAETLQDGTTTLPLATTSATSITSNYGIVFDITTKDVPLTIVGFNKYSTSLDASACAIYTKQGSYAGFETNELAWTFRWTYYGSNVDKQEWTGLNLYIPAHTTYSVMLYSNMPVTLYNQESSTYSDSKIIITSGKMIGSGLFSTPVSAATMVGSVVYKYGPETTSATRTPVTVTVHNAPTDITLSPNSVNENVAANTTVGTLSTTDLNAGDTFTYSLPGNWNGNNNFTISGNKLNIVNSPDFEVNGSYSVKVLTTDQTGLSFEKVLTVTINDVAEAPTVSTLAATSISKDTGTLNGTINANNLSTTVTFEYGLTNSYGSTVTADQSPVTGHESTPVSKTITGLVPLTTYHYRVKGVNSAGTTYGDDRTFTTTDIAPVITSTPDLTVPYDNLYSYIIEATKEGTLETTLTVPTKPAWLSFKQGQSQAVLIGNIPAGTVISSAAGDNEGNVYAITSDGTTIYKIEANGTTTLWRSGLASVTANALHIANGYIYIARNINSQSVTRIPLSNTSATEESFFSTYGGARSLTDKDGWIYITNSSYREIYRVNETTKETKLLLNSSNGIPFNPYGLTFGNDGDLYIATYGTKTIIKYDGSKLLTGTPGDPTTVLSGLPLNVTGIRQDKSGNFYVSMNGRGVLKYTSDFSSSQLISSGFYDYVIYLSLTASGELVYSKSGTNEIYHMQTCSSLNGTPAKSNIGQHPVVIRAENSDGHTEQSFTINVIDNVGPVITPQTPANNATSVALKPTLNFTFDEAVNLGTSGTLTVYNGATLLRSFDLSVPEEKAQLVLSADRLSLSVTLSENLPVNTQVSVGISAGFVKDDYNNSCVGFSAASNTWRFTTINKNVQTINFPIIVAKTYGDATFTLGDAKTNQNLTVSYTATDPSVVSITGNQATILKAGTTVITATQVGDDQNFAATPVEQTLTVGKATLTVTADAKTKVYGEATPSLVFSYSGWKNGVEIIDTPPAITTTVNAATVSGTHIGAITVSGGSDNNYTFSYVPANMEVTKATLTVTADAKTKVYGTANPSLTFQYSGWKNSDTEAVLDTKPSASTTVDLLTNTGTYSNAIVVSGGSDNNYTFSYVPANMEVTKATLTVTADAKTKVYGESNPALTFQYSGWKNSETETVLDTKPGVSTTVNQLTNAGTYPGAIVVSGGSDNNYTFSYVPANMEVTKATLTVTADAKTKVYGSANPSLTFQYSGWKNSETETVLDTKPSASTTVDLLTNTGTYSNAIVVSGGSDNNYTFSYVPANMEVTKATLTVTADAKTKVYGTANPSLTFQYSGWKNSDTEAVLDTKPSASTTVDLLTNTGTYSNAIVVSGGSDNNYTFSYVPANMEVTKATLTVTADAKTKVYGTANPSLTFQYSGWKNSDTEAVLDTKPSASTTVDLLTNTGTYSNAIVVSGGSDNNYTFSYVPANMEVTKATLTVTADAKTKVYGESNPALTFQYSGWKNSETETVLDTKPGVSTTVNQLTNAGTYTGAIVVSGGSDNNYTFSYVPANMEVTKATLTVTADAKTKVYGESNPALTFQYSGWKNSETEAVLDTKPSASTTVDLLTSVGNYPGSIVVSGGVDNNYTFSYVPANMEVTKATLTVAADAKTKVYGEANPSLTFQYSGWKNGETEAVLDTKPSASTTVDLFTNAGTHVGIITVSGGSDNNYTFSYVPANMEVTKATLTVTADAKTKVYGEANPALTFQYSGWKNGETETVLDTKPSASTTVDLFTNAGTHVGVITVSGGSDNNYTFNYVSANMEVTKATLTVTADAKSKVYGATNPSLTFQYSGWKNSETEAVLDTKPGASTTVDLLTSVGNYPGSIVISGGVDNNYTFSYVPANMEVTKATLTVTADAKTKVYGESNPALTFQYSGWKNGETETVLDTKPGVLTTVNQLTNAGTYPGAIVVSGGSDNNYTFSYVPANMEVTKATLTVKADSKARYYGEANSTLTFQYSGWKNGETETVLDTKPSVSTTFDLLTSVGIYSGAIVVFGGSDNNYTFNYIPADLEVVKATLTVAADAKTKIYGENTPILTFRYSGWKNGETETVLNIKPTVSTTVDLLSAVGTYLGAIWVSGGIDDNYSFNYIPAAMEVKKAPLTVIADNKTKTYGEANPELTYHYSGWVNGEETIDIAPLISTTINEATAVGKYDGAITLSDGTDNNYSFNYVAGDFEVTAPKIAGDINGDGKIIAPELAGDKNGNGVIDGDEVGGDTSGNGIIDGSEIAGDQNGNGKIDGSEIAGDINGDGKIVAPELAGDKNGNGVIDDDEVGGDTSGNGIIDGSEIAGDQDGNSKIDGSEIAGDKNSDGKIVAPELAGDKNGNGVIDGDEVGGDTSGNGIIDGSEIAGDQDGNGKIDGSEIAGDKNSDGKIVAPELAGDKNGNGVIDGDEVGGDTSGNGIIDSSEIAGDQDGNGKIDGSEIAGDKNSDGKIVAPELAGDKNGNGVIDGDEVAGDTNGNGRIEGSEIAGDQDGNGKIDVSEIAGDINGDGKIVAPELSGDKNGNGIIDGNESPSTGIDTQESVGKLSAYSIRNIEIKLKGQVGRNAVATLIDMQGRIIVVKNLEEGVLNSIPTPYIRTGTYLLLVKDQARTQTIKVPVRE